MKKTITFLATVLLAGSALADISSLGVQFNPSATSYSKGTPVAVTATANGTNTQYKFELDRIASGVAVAVVSSNWSLTNTFNVDTNAVNVQPGKHRLRVLARESANKPETLVKTEFFQITAPPTVTACESIENKTYTIPAAASFVLGDLTLASALALQGAGIPVELGGGDASHVKSVKFQNDVASVTLGGIETRVCAFLCIAVSQNFINPVDLPYTCSGNTVTVNAGAVMSATQMSPGTLTDLLGGGSFPVRVTGNLLINSGGNSVTADGVTFE